MAVITVHENVSLKLFSTMRLGGNARFVCEVTSKADVAEAVRFAKKRQLQCRVIGIGSNIIWQDSGFNGLLIVNKILGQFIHSDGVSITFGAGHFMTDDAAHGCAAQRAQRAARCLCYPGVCCSEW